MLAGEKIVSVKSFSQPGGISFVKAEIKNPLVKKVVLSRTYFKIQLLLYHTACVQLVPVTFVAIPLLCFYSLSIAHKLKKIFWLCLAQSSYKSGFLQIENVPYQ